MPLSSGFSNPWTFGPELSDLWGPRKFSDSHLMLLSCWWRWDWEQGQLGLSFAGRPAMKPGRSGGCRLAGCLWSMPSSLSVEDLHSRGCVLLFGMDYIWSGWGTKPRQGVSGCTVGWRMGRYSSEQPSPRACHPSLFALLNKMLGSLRGNAGGSGMAGGRSTSLGH